MTAVMGRTDIAIRKIGGQVIIADNPKANLMYYLDCICTVLDLSDTANLTSLRNFNDYDSLTEAGTDALVALCILLSPDELCGKVIFQDSAMCGDMVNAFYEINAVHHNLVVSDSIIIGGQRRAVSKIMAFKPEWLVKYWGDPMKDFGRARIEGADAVNNSNNTNDDCCCTIL